MLYSNNMREEFLKPYDPATTENRIYKMWEESGYFNPDNLPDTHQTPFTIVLPPPNVTGTLHSGHASMLAIEDILIRYKRLRGYKTLWLPGTDHAAIATQSKVEKDILKKEGKSRHDIGREEMLKRIGQFAQESHDTIVNQCKRMGSSLDWSREAFTLDEKRNLAVRTAFKRMYDDGLIYRAYKVINWDPKGQTTISDDEIQDVEREAVLYTFKYSPDFPIAISTTRPETKFGDTAVAVHPDDERYTKYIGKEYDFVFCGVPVHVKIVADTAVEKEFGTGALGVTPAHSKVDEEIAKRHNLPTVPVINSYAKMTVGTEATVLNKKTTEAREIVVAWLRKENLILEEKTITQNIPTAERTGGIVEPLPMLQWFINVNKEFTLAHSDMSFAKKSEVVSLKDLMHRAVESGAIEILPDRFGKVYHNWINNLRDWCISRQIWYGHRIPVWYKDNKIYCDIDAPDEEGWKQDEDTLDTWFSSGLWTFSTLGWPEKTKDFQTFHPTDVLETGYDILFFWVARMILMTTYLVGQIPFKTVYLHGLVRAQSGEKMSKSLNNAIDPLEMIEKYGADALRMSLVIGTGPGNDSKISEEKIKAYKHFANKLWNITRFVLTNAEEYDTNAELVGEDAVLVSEWKDELKAVTDDLASYRFYLAGEKLYAYAWHRFADVILEDAKKRLIDADEHSAQSIKKMLRSIHYDLLVTLHPFMPYITEEIWGMIKQTGENPLIIASWPNSSH